MNLSVVIPVYNGADFIRKSYDSIVKQNIKDFEIIYVDNNSEDDSVKNIKQLVNTDSRVSLYHQERQGAGPTRNLGIEMAKGRFVYLLDVDDAVFPNALKNMISVLMKHPEVDAVFGKMKKSHQAISDILQPENETFEVVIKEKPYWGIRWFSNLADVVGPPAFLYRASVFETIGAYNDELRLGQDTAFDIKLGMLCNIAFLDMFIYLYFKHEASTTQSVKKNTSRAFMVWPRLVREHLPFYLEHETPLRFKTLLFAQLFQSIGRQILFTKGFSNRLHLKRKLLSELKTIRIPFIIRVYLPILVLFPFEFVGKIYGR